MIHELRGPASWSNFTRLELGKTNEKNMNLADIIFLGWYQILDKTIYSYGNEDRGIGPREHSLFITFLFHGINVWTILRYAVARYFNTGLSLYFSLSVGILIFMIGYLIYIRKNGARRVININVTTIKIILCVSVAIVYAVVSVLLDV
jgi:hypothetical protein